MPAPRLGDNSESAAARSSTGFTDVSETFETLAELTATLFRCDAVAFFIWDHAAERLSPAWHHGFSPRAAAAFAKLSVRRAAAWARLLQRPNALIATPKAGGSRQAVAWRDWRAVYASPLRHAGRLHGAMCLCYRSATAPERIPNRAALRAWSASAALAVSLAQLAEHERGAGAQAIALSENLRDLTAPIELREMLGRLAQRALNTEGLRACGVLLRDAAAHTLRVAALAGASADFVAVATARDFPDQLLKFPPRGYIVIRPDVIARFMPVDPVSENIGRTLVVPVMHGAEIAGAVCLVAAQPERVFTSQQIHWARGLAEQAAVVIETGRLYQRARMLSEVAAAPPYPFDRDAYLVEVARRVRSVLGTPACSAWLWEPADATMRLSARSAAESLRPPGRGHRRLPISAFTPWTPHTKHAAVRLALRSRSRLTGWVGATHAHLVPIATATRVFGALIAAEPEPRGDRGGFAQILAGIADVTALRLEQQALLDQAAERERELARHREREQLARDLHDTVLQTLTGIGLQLTALQRRDTAVGVAELAALEDTVRDQFRLVQAFLNRLRSAGAHAVDLRAEVQRLVDDCARRGRLRTQVTIRGAEAIAAPVASEISLIVREALANVEKHARAERAAIAIRARDGYIDVSVRDRGRGFPKAVMAGRYVRESALPWSIRERVAALFGRLQIDSTPGRGSVVRIRIPYHQPVVVEPPPYGVHSAHKVRRAS